MFSLKSTGSTDKLERALRKMSKLDVRNVLERAGREGVAALRSATPSDSGLAAYSWDYEIRQNRSSVSIVWTNSDVEGGFPVAIMLQYGYATGTGGYVSGRDYINPAMRPVFDRIANDVWREVTRG